MLKMLKISNLIVEYEKNLPVLKGISLNVKKGESIGVLGANGTGKTTLFNAILGLVEKKDGEIVIDGLELSKKNLLDIRRMVGLVFQNPDDQLFMPTVLDDVSFAPKNCKVSNEEAEKKAVDLLEKLNLKYLVDKSPIKLSGGEKRIVAIAGILITNPKLILLDEPTAFLDYPAKKKMTEIINNVESAKLIATHDIKFVVNTCERVIILKDGEIKENIKKDDLIKNSDILEKYEIEGF